MAVWLKTLLLGSHVLVWYSYRQEQVGGARPAAVAQPAAAVTASAADGEKAEEAEAPAQALVPLKIVFASQTGTAEGFAATLGAEAKSRGFQPTIVCVDEYAQDDLEETLCSETALVVLAATYGEGEPTDDAVQLYKWLKPSGGSRDLEPGSPGQAALRRVRAGRPHVRAVLLHGQVLRQPPRGARRHALPRTR